MVAMAIRFKAVSKATIKQYTGLQSLYEACSRSGQEMLPKVGTREMSEQSL